MESEKKEEPVGQASDEAKAPLNRAERRALEHKKKSSAGNTAQNAFGNQSGRSGGGFTGTPGKSRLPRTGHKGG